MVDPEIEVVDLSDVEPDPVALDHLRRRLSNRSPEETEGGDST